LHRRPRFESRGNSGAIIHRVIGDIHLIAVAHDAPPGFGFASGFDHLCRAVTGTGSIILDIRDVLVLFHEFPLCSIFRCNRGAE
jgi:hypothetical protein